MPRSLLLLLPALCLAQTPPPAFEVASIKPMSLGDTGVHWSSDPGRLSMKNMSLRNLIVTAYGLREDEYSGPAWLDSARYTIEATAAEKVDEPRLLLMLQTLLADRFKLAFHREPRQAAGYALVVAKGGIKMRPSQATGSESHGARNKYTATGLDMPEFVRFLARITREAVVDETHLTGGYDFVLEFSRPARQAPGAAEPAAADDPTAPPSIFDALPAQLGLKLEPRKVPIQMLIVDRIERPSEN